VEYWFLLFAGLALLGAIYTSRSGFAALRQSNLSIRGAKWLTAMNLLIAMLLAPAAIHLHFLTKHYFGMPSMYVWCFYGLGNSMLFFVAVYFFIKSLATFRLWPSRFWTFFTASGILFGWSFWLLLSFLFLTLVH
jgi:hypothetical protein